MSGLKIELMLEERTDPEFRAALRAAGAMPLRAPLDACC